MDIPAHIQYKQVNCYSVLHTVIIIVITINHSTKQTNTMKITTIKGLSKNKLKLYTRDKYNMHTPAREQAQKHHSVQLTNQTLCHEHHLIQEIRLATVIIGAAKELRQLRPELS